MCSSHEIQATINAIGYLEEGEYFKGTDCLNALKDLIRYLRRDDPNEKTIRRELLKSDVLSNDLIPLLTIVKPKKEALLFDIVLRLLVNLTQSALNCFELKIPEDKIQYNIYLEIDNQLKRVKESFANEAFIRVLSEQVSSIMKKEWQDRPEEEELILERILFLIRNVLLIKNTEDDNNRLESDLNSHDLLILNLHKTNLLDNLIEMANSSLNVKYTIHLLEIITLILREQSAEELAKVSESEVNLNSKRSVVEKEKDNDELAKLQMRDLQVRKHNKMRLNPRHSRFMGTYVAVNMKSINDENKLIVHKHAKEVSDLLDDKNKKAIRKAKNKIVFENDQQQRKSVLFIRIILKKFCTSLIKTSYSFFFRNLKDLLQRKKLEDDETCYYYWLVQFLTEFTRNSDMEEQNKIELIKETFTLELFHSIEVFIQRCFEMMKVDKKQNKLWAKRMHSSLKCYKENLITLYALEKKIAEFESKQKNSTESQKLNNIDTNIDLDDEEALVNLAESTLTTSTQKSTIPTEPQKLLDERTTDLIDQLKNQLFYIQEFRELFIMMLREFDHSKMSKNFLRDLIEANHIFILMLENHKKKGVLSIACKKKKKKLKKTKNDKNSKKETKEEKQKRLKEEEEFNKRVEEQEIDFKEKVWNKNFSRVASLIQSQVEFNVENDNLMPFDFVATSDKEFDAQKENVIEKIQHLLVENKPDDSITLFREARYLWQQDRDLFGYDSIQPDEEFETYKNLFMKQLEIKKPIPKKTEQENNDMEVNEKKINKKQKNKENDEGIEDDFDNEEKEEAFDTYDNEEKEKNPQEEDEDDEDEENGGYVLQEENLDFEKFLFRFTHPHILKSYILMMGEYEKNNDFLNRCCMSMFERIAYECHAPQCLYQLSFFNLINKILKDPLSKCIMNIMDSSQKKSIDDIYASTYSTEDMFSFFRQLISKFFEQTSKNPKLYLEVLFFKDKKIIHELGEESTGYQPITQGSNGKNRKIAWTEDEQTELKELFEKYKTKFEKNEENEDNDNEIDQEDLENQQAGDIIDLILLNLKEGNRKRKDICNQLANIGCVGSLDVFKTDKYTFKNKKKLGRNKLWREEDVNDLKQCFQLINEEAKQLEKPLHDMMNKLQTCLKIKRNKSVIIDKLLSLGLINSKSEIAPSKRKNKDKKNKNEENDFVVDDDDSDLDKEKLKKKNKKKKNKEKKLSNDLFDAESGSSSDEIDSSSSESESDSDESDEEKSSSKIRTLETRDQVLEGLGLNEELNEESNESENPKPKKKKSNILILSDDSDDDVNKKTEKSKSTKLDSIQKIKDSKKVKKSKPKKGTLDQEEDDDEDNIELRKKVAKKRKKIIDSNEEDSRSSTASNKKDEDSIENQNKSQINEIAPNKSIDSDDDSDDDLPLGSLVSSKRQRLVLSEDDD